MLCIYQELDSNTTLLRKTALRELTGESKQLERNNYPFLMGGKKKWKKARTDPAMNPTGSSKKISCICRTFSNSNKINDHKNHL